MAAARLALTAVWTPRPCHSTSEDCSRCEAEKTEDMALDANSC